MYACSLDKKNLISLWLWVFRKNLLSCLEMRSKGERPNQKIQQSVLVSLDFFLHQFVTSLILKAGFLFYFVFIVLYISCCVFSVLTFLCSCTLSVFLSVSPLCSFPSLRLCISVCFHFLFSMGFLCCSFNWNVFLWFSL